MSLLEFGELHRIALGRIGMETRGEIEVRLLQRCWVEIGPPGEAEDGKVVGHAEKLSPQEQ